MISKILIQKIIREEINKLIESPGEVRPPQSTTKILPKSDEDAHVDRKIYGGSTLDLDVDGKPNNPKKFGASDIYKSAREENKNKTLSEGLRYHLKNSISINDNVYRPGTREFFSLIKEAKSLWEEGKYSATPEEYEIFQSDIGEWAMYEGKRVPLDFPMWDSVDEEKKGLWHNIRKRREKGLPKKKPGEKGYPKTLDINESFADHFRKNKWVKLSRKEIEQHPELFDEMFSMIDQSYSNIGGHANYQSPEDIRNDNDISIFSLIDVDDDNEADAVDLKKTTRHGAKSVALATDGSRPAKDALLKNARDDFSIPGHYGEVSGALAKIMLKMGVSVVNDESVVREVLGGKPIKWFGAHPKGEFPGTDGWYGRKIGEEFHEKIMIGFPITRNMQEAKYKGREVKLGTAGASQSGGRAHVYVRDPKSGNIRKVSFGSGMPDAMGSSPKHKKRRKSFAARHGCSKNHDKTSASYWACRSTKMFGRNVPGWW
jgi:hypothetical protein